VLQAATAPASFLSFTTASARTPRIVRQRYVPVARYGRIARRWQQRPAPIRTQSLQGFALPNVSAPTTSRCGIVPRASACTAPRALGPPRSPPPPRPLASAIVTRRKTVQSGTSAVLTVRRPAWNLCPLRPRMGRLARTSAYRSANVPSACRSGTPTARASAS
jgi:hypothetical protein